MTEERVLSDREKIAEIIVECITEWYANWRSRNDGSREPNITATLVRDYVLDVSGCPKSLKYESKRRQDSMVRSVLISLVKQGVLETSIGFGDRGEARCYEPKRQENQK